MDLDQMIAVLEAAKRGEVVEQRSFMQPADNWEPQGGAYWNFAMFDYRVAPKEMTLVEELRVHEHILTVCGRAANRIEELEECMAPSTWSTDELINEIRARMLDKC